MNKVDLAFKLSINSGQALPAYSRAPIYRIRGEAVSVDAYPVQWNIPSPMERRLSSCFLLYFGKFHQWFHLACTAKSEAINKSHLLGASYLE